MNESLESRLQAAVYETLRLVEQNDVMSADTAALEAVVLIAEEALRALTELCDRL